MEYKVSLLANCARMQAFPSDMRVPSYACHTNVPGTVDPANSTKPACELSLGHYNNSAPITGSLKRPWKQVSFRG